MRLNNGPGNRKPHAHPVGLGREERFKNARQSVRCDSIAGVTHEHFYRAVAIYGRADS